MAEPILPFIPVMSVSVLVILTVWLQQGAGHRSATFGLAMVCDENYFTSARIADAFARFLSPVFPLTSYRQKASCNATMDRPVFYTTLYNWRLLNESIFRALSAAAQVETSEQARRNSDACRPLLSALSMLKCQSIAAAHYVRIENRQQRGIRPAPINGMNAIS